jgi:hypothetical protein
MSISRQQPSEPRSKLPDVLAGMTIGQILEEVSRGSISASDALKAEQAGKARKTLVATLAEWVDR